MVHLRCSKSHNNVLVLVKLSVLHVFKLCVECNSVTYISKCLVKMN